MTLLASASAELNIVATTGMVADITRQVVGEHGTVDCPYG